jgi:hypothetical protein
MCPADSLRGNSPRSTLFSDHRWQGRGRRCSIHERAWLQNSRLAPVLKFVVGDCVGTQTTFSGHGTPPFVEATVREPPSRFVDPSGSVTIGNHSDRVRATTATLPMGTVRRDPLPSCCSVEDQREKEVGERVSLSLWSCSWSQSSHSWFAWIRLSRCRPLKLARVTG